MKTLNTAHIGVMIALQVQSSCEVRGIRPRVQVFRRELYIYIYIYTHLDYAKVEFLSYIKKENGDSCFCQTPK